MKYKMIVTDIAGGGLSQFVGTERTNKGERVCDGVSMLNRNSETSFYLTPCPWSKK